MCDSRDEVIGVQARQGHPQESWVEPLAIAEQHPLRTKNSVTHHYHGVLTPPTPFFYFVCFCVPVEMNFKSYKYIYIYVYTYIRFSPPYFTLPALSPYQQVYGYIFWISKLLSMIIIVWYTHCRQQQKRTYFLFLSFSVTVFLYKASLFP